MKTSALWFLLLAGLVAVTNNSLCNPIGPSQMQAGQVTFTASSGVPQNIISVPLPFALSSQTIQSSTSNLHHNQGIASFGTHSLVNGIDFLLNSRVRDNSNTLDVILLLRYIGWTNIVASYFATTLSTVFTGGFMVSTERITKILPILTTVPPLKQQSTTVI